MSTMELRELDLHITNRCNYQCSVCCFSSNEKYLPELTTRELFRVIDQAITLGCDTVHFTGGEPLIRNDIVELVSYANSFGMHLRLQTNGTLFTSRLGKALVEAGLNNIMFSLDSLDEQTNRMQRAPHSFPFVRQAIELALQFGMDVRVNAVLTKFNTRHLVPLAVRMAKLGVKKISAFYFSPIGRGRRHVDLWLTPEEYFESYQNILTDLQTQKDQGNIQSDVDVVLEKGYSTWEEAKHISVAGFTGCGAGCAHVFANRDYLIIRCDGNVYPCILSIDWMQPLGNVRQQPLAHIWRNSPSWQQLNRENLKQVCNGCEYWTLCNGGCAGYSQLMASDYKQVDPRCRRGILVPLCPIMKYNVRNNKLGGSSEDVVGSSS